MKSKKIFMLSISIAMTTYNGSKYLQEQLDSFSNQTLLPNELVVVDDCSTDKTVDILNNFQRKTPFRVKIIRNNENVGSKTKYGYSQNFEKAIKNCCGDIIFLSDQDDVWFPNKIEKHLEVYYKNKNIFMIANDAIRTYSNLSHCGLTQSEFGKIVQIDSSKTPNKKSLIGIGCCYSIRSDALKIILPIPENIPHDNWIRKCFNELRNYYCLNDSLQYFRRLETSWSTINEFGNGVSKYESYLTKYIRILNYIVDIKKFKTNLKTEINLEKELLNRINKIININDLYKFYTNDEKKAILRKIENRISLLSKRLNISKVKNNLFRLKLELNLIKSSSNYSIALAIKDWLME